MKVNLSHESCNVHTHTHMYTHYCIRIKDTVDSTRDKTTYSNEGKLLLEVVDVRQFSYADMLHMYIFKGN